MCLLSCSFNSYFLRTFVSKFKLVPSPSLIRAQFGKRTKNGTAIPEKYKHLYTARRWRLDQTQLLHVHPATFDDHQITPLSVATSLAAKFLPGLSASTSDMPVQEKFGDTHPLNSNSPIFRFAPVRHDGDLNFSAAFSAHIQIVLTPTLGRGFGRRVRTNIAYLHARLMIRIIASQTCLTVNTFFFRLPQGIHVICFCLETNKRLCII